MSIQSPLIAITLDSRVDPDHTTSPRTYHSGAGYGDAVAAAGGVPIWVGHDLAVLPRIVELCEGFILTGGDDPDVAAFGGVTHPDARVLDARRQAFELALLDALDSPPHADKPVLAVCLGMQLMALRAGGRLDQAMGETMGDAAGLHRGFQPHPVTIDIDTPMLPPRGERCDVISSHRQRITDPGRLAVAATADDDTIEAVVDADRSWRLGVQWHPERSRDPSHLLGWGLIRRLIRAAAR